MAQIQKLDDRSFEAYIAEGVTLVDFWATWCAPCRLQDPAVERVAEAAGDSAKVAKVNVDEAMQAAASVGIQAIPTLILFKDGAPVREFVGLAPEEELMTALSELLPGE